MHFRFAPAVAALLAAGSTLAFAASERGNPTAKVDGHTISIDYGRPALKGRALSELLGKLSSDRVWRAGDDQVTTLTTDTDLMIGGKRVKAGKYSVYVHLPQDGARNLILSTDLGQPLVSIYAAAPDNLKQAPWPYIGDYQAKIADKEVLRVPMKKETVSAPVDLFAIDLTPAKDAANLKLSWGNESWSIELKPAK